VQIISFFRWRDGLEPAKAFEAMAKRADWKYPEGVKNVGEYWPSGGDPAIPAVVAVDDYDDPKDLMEVDLFWGEYFEITHVPCMTSEEGLRYGGEIVARMAG